VLSRDIPPLPTAVLASGQGTNLQAVIDAARGHALPIDLRLVLSDTPNAFALQRARNAGIPTAVCTFDRAAADRAAYALQVASHIRRAGARLVLLLGWMHVFAEQFLNEGFDGVLNLHPAYLPEDPGADIVTFPDGSSSPVFRGPRALRDAIASNARYTGATLMQITADVDRGPVLARRPMVLHPGESEEVALERLHSVERDVVREGIARWLEARRPA